MIAILLSVFNGEKYLKDQIVSILNQDYTDWKLFVRDDASTDSSLSLLHGLRNEFPDKIIIDTSQKMNLGAGKSFMHLLEIAEADYYMFCDQDDVWMPDKISKTLSKAKELESQYGQDTPIGVFTDLTVVDKSLNILMPSLWNADNRHPEYTKNFYKQWTNRHATYGCTMLFNMAAKRLVLPFKQLEGVQGAHDTWVEYLLIKNGKYDYINEPTIYYRQHSSNVIGANMGITYRDEVNEMMTDLKGLYHKLQKDYRRCKSMPFKVSFTKVLAYRIFQSVMSLIDK